MTVKEFIQKFIDAGWVSLSDRGRRYPDEYPKYYNMTRQMHRFLAGRGLPDWCTFFLIKRSDDNRWLFYVWTPKVNQEQWLNAADWNYVSFMVHNLDDDIGKASSQSGWDRVEAMIEFLGMDAIIDEYVDLDNIVF